MSASPDEQQAIYRRAAEMQVINHAMKQHNGCAPETCGGTGYDPCHLGSAIEDLLRRYSRIGGWQAATATEGAEMVKRLDLGQETGSLVVNHGAEIAADQCTCPLGPEDAHLSDCPMFIHGWDEPAPAPLWVRRTWADVRRGDVVRMPGTDVVAAITDRLWHPSEDPRGESWHVVSDGSTSKWAHTSDRVIRPGECVIVSPDIPGSERGRWMDPAAAVEIQLPDAQTLAGIEALGWENRLHTMDSAPNPGEG